MILKAFRREKTVPLYAGRVEKTVSEGFNQWLA
jgi:hypothetical protein